LEDRDTRWGGAKKKEGGKGGERREEKEGELIKTRIKIPRGRGGEFGSRGGESWKVQRTSGCLKGGKPNSYEVMKGRGSS